MTAVNLKAQAAARVYLGLRGFEILEQNWGLGRHKVDLVAKGKNDIYFISLKHHPEGQIDSFPEISRTALDRRRQAAEAWVHETKWTGGYKFAQLEMSGYDYTVIGFSEETA